MTDRKSRRDNPADSPVIIIGAARSGTNMLRNVLCSLPGIRTWPCDEIPFIWRHGNRRHPDDEFSPEMARPDVRRFVQDWFARQCNPQTRLLVEKTCANSLRLGFVDRIFPSARYLIITRSGSDAVASAMRRWTAGFELRYSLAKARFVPFSDLPCYAAAFAWNRFQRLVRPTRRLSLWGPVVRGMRDWSPAMPLAEVAARQWVRCIQRTASDLCQIPPHRRHHLKYEDFVAAPEMELATILDFLDCSEDAAVVARASAGVRRDSVGKAVRHLAPGDQELVHSIVVEAESALRSIEEAG